MTGYEHMKHDATLGQGNAETGGKPARDVALHTDRCLDVSLEA